MTTDRNIGLSYVNCYKKRTVICEGNHALALITRLLTSRADNLVITTAQIKILSDIKYHTLNMITHRNLT